MKGVLLCSTSKIKEAAVRDFYRTLDENINLTCFDCGPCGLPEQPIGDDYDTNGVPRGYLFAKERMNYARSHVLNFDSFDVVVSIENVINITLEEDNAYVLMYSKGALGRGLSNGARVPDRILASLIAQPEIIYAYGLRGYQRTAGDFLHDLDPKVNPKNWMSSEPNCITREIQIDGALQRAYRAMTDQFKIHVSLKQTFTQYPDWPTPGVLFEDMFPLLSDSKMFQSLINALSQIYEHDRLDHIVGLESRGFLLGACLAFKLQTRFVPIRKVGKLPGKKYTVSYSKEYGIDACEISQNAIKPRARVLIIDDLIATGGSLRAACDLVEKCDGVIVDCCVLRSVIPLKEKCDATMRSQHYTVLLP